VTVQKGRNQTPLARGSNKTIQASGYPSFKLDCLPLDYYQLLKIPHSASYSEIKSAYHHALLTSHPDKSEPSSRSTSGVDIAQLKEAYTTLSTPHLRSQYDTTLVAGRVDKGPRPAQVISLEDFEERSDDGFWYHKCRCGGDYVICEADMEMDRHLVGCSACSEVVWVGYEVIEGD
jgi:diphthamide biosynthesis protein 4